MERDTGYTRIILMRKKKKITDSQVEEAQKSIQKLLEENHLINEDIKGIEIDLRF